MSLMNLPQSGRSAHPVIVTNGGPFRRRTFHLRAGRSLTFYVATFWRSIFFSPQRGRNKKKLCCSPLSLPRPGHPSPGPSCRNWVALWVKSRSVASRAGCTLSFACRNQQSLFGLLEPLPTCQSEHQPVRRDFPSFAWSAVTVYRITASGFTLSV